MFKRNDEPERNPAVIEREAAASVEGFLRAFQIDLSNPHLKNTPNRVAKSWREFFLSGYDMDVNGVLSVEFSAEKYDQMIVVKDVSFSSLCAHHLVPFVGVAKVGYLPRDGRITGLSKLARIVEMYARRLQIQEQMTQQIANSIMEKLNPVGVGVVIEAEHMCMTIRGIQKPGAKTITSCLLGCFRDDTLVRDEFLAF